MKAKQRDRWRALVSGLATLVVFAVGESAGTYRWPVGLLIGVLVGTAVFVAQWLLVVRRGRFRC